MNEKQSAMLNSRVGRISTLMTLRERPNLDGDWVALQSATVNSDAPDAFNGFSLNERVVILRPDEVRAMFGEELDPEDVLS